MAKEDDIEYWIKHAIRTIKNDYGDSVDIKPKNLLKFGENPVAGTSQTTIMELAFANGDHDHLYQTAHKIAGGSTFQINFRPFIIVPKNSDVIMTAQASAANTAVTGGFNTLIALVNQG